MSVGRKRRTISGALKRALYKRDQACTFPGCTHQAFLEGHHIKHWADGGETSLSTTALLCRLCRARHKLHYADRLVMRRRGGALDEDVGALRGIIRARSGRRGGYPVGGTGQEPCSAARCERVPAPS
jgi:hypothetical protein